MTHGVILVQVSATLVSQASFRVQQAVGRVLRPGPSHYQYSWHGERLQLIFHRLGQLKGINKGRKARLVNTLAASKP